MPGNSTTFRGTPRTPRKAPVFRSGYLNETTTSGSYTAVDPANRSSLALAHVSKAVTARWYASTACSRSPLARAASPRSNSSMAAAIPTHPAISISSITPFHTGLTAKSAWRMRTVRTLLSPSLRQWITNDSRADHCARQRQPTRQSKRQSSSRSGRPSWDHQDYRLEPIPCATRTRGPLPS